MQDEHRPCAFADDEVALPMAGLAAAFNDLRTIMDRASILDGVARGSGATRATAFVATRQIPPQGLGLLSSPIDEGVDCLAADGPQPRFIPGFQPTGYLFGRPSLGEPIPWIPERSATGLREADLNVLSKLGNQGLEWRLEPEAFTGREVRREDDLLDFLVGCAVDIQVARQPST